jgi:hypothetical protein
MNEEPVEKEQSTRLQGICRAQIMRIIVSLTV